MSVATDTYGSETHPYEMTGFPQVPAWNPRTVSRARYRLPLDPVSIRRCSCHPEEQSDVESYRLLQYSAGEIFIRSVTDVLYLCPIGLFVSVATDTYGSETHPYEVTGFPQVPAWNPHMVSGVRDRLP